MTETTPERLYINLAEALRLWTPETGETRIRKALKALPLHVGEYRDLLHDTGIFLLIHTACEGMEADPFAKIKAKAISNLADGLDIHPDFDKTKFLRHAQSEPDMLTPPRRSWVVLAEAVRTVNGPTGLRDMLRAIAGLNLGEEARQTVLTTFLANTPHRWGFTDIHRENLAGSFSRLLEGQPKFDPARFLHHATSDSSADDDGDSGKWSYNHNNPGDAMKTTIEGGDETIVL